MTALALAPRAGWQDQAACRAEDPETFFHEGTDSAPVNTRTVTRAKRICSACPVTRECLAFAQAKGEAAGTWGGQTAQERAAARRPRRTRTRRAAA